MPPLNRALQVGRSDFARRSEEEVRAGQAQRFASGGPVFKDFNSLLGAAPQLSGNLVSRTGTGEVRSLAQLAGQRSTQLSEEERGQLEQFFSPTVNENQQAQLEAIAKRAAAQGLAGGAVSSQLSDLATRFVAQNRSQAFGAVQDIVGRQLGSIRERVSPFLQQIGGFRSALFDSAPGQVGAATQNILGASGGTTEDFLGFARTGLDALSAVGLGADALAGIAEQAGVVVGNEGVTGAGDISRAFTEFLDPGAGAFGQLGTGADLTRANNLRVARAAQRVGAGEQLAARVGGIFQDLSAQGAELGALGSAAQAFTQTGDLGAARQLAGVDLSRFRGLTGALGLGENAFAGSGQRGRFAGTFIAGNPLFRTVFGT